MSASSGHPARRRLLLAAALLSPSAAAARPPRLPTPGPATMAPFEPRQIVVPPSLWRTNETLEPSGVVWAAPLERYLVVSDDTGEGKRRHAPWVLAMDRDGRFDAAPVPIVGVEAVNDAESICAGPGGTFFLVTSHSLNKKGHLKPERRMLLQLRLEQRALRVVGRVDLTTTRGPAGEPLLAIAGLPVDGKLDIEAIAWRGDGKVPELLIGLKAPLSATGGAVVLRFADPVPALARGSVPPGAVTRLAELPLRTTSSAPGGATVGEGISDLLPLPGGDLLLLANSPKGLPSDGGGSLYRLAAGASVPLLLRRFPGRKPEGITLSHDGGGVVMVFDNDTRAPLWASAPLAAVR